MVVAYWILQKSKKSFRYSQAEFYDVLEATQMLRSKNKYRKKSYISTFFKRQSNSNLIKADPLFIKYISSRRNVRKEYSIDEAAMYNYLKTKNIGEDVLQKFYNKYMWCLQEYYFKPNEILCQFNYFRWEF